MFFTNNLVPPVKNWPSGMVNGTTPSMLQMTATTSANGKPWHNDVNLQSRDHEVHKLIQSVLPNNIDPYAVRDRRMINLVAYAKKVEVDMYEGASSQEQYKNMLAEKVYKIQKELEEKRFRRQQMQATGSGHV